MRLFRLTPLLAAPIFALGTAVGSAASPGMVANVPQVPGLRDLGRAAATTRMSLGVVLNYRHQTELESLVDAQAEPGSRLYHHFLTSRQFNGYFAPSEADYARVANSLVKAGFAITHTSANRTIIDVSAPAATVERYFGTEIHRVMQPGEGVRLANAKPAFAPSDVRGLVLGVAGLDTLRLIHTDFERAANARPIVDGVSKRFFGPDGGYSPRVFAHAYGVPTALKNNGAGQASGVVIDADFLDSDLSAYLAQFKITRTGPPTTRVLIDGGPPPGLGSPDSVETTLDVETITSLAPATALYVYEFPDFSNVQYILDAYNQVVIDNKVGTVNSSFGGCENNFGGPFTTFPKLSDAIALQGVALGITFHASTGDGGNITFGCNTTSVNAPAVDPHFSAIGGTTLFIDPNTAAYESEVGWSGSGGGVSTVFKLPGYQKGVAGVITSGRNIPDVSFDADPATGESWYYAGFWSGPIGGTSLSSPIFGAGITILNQALGSRAGWADPQLYAIFKAIGYGTVFRDITKGFNGYYTAGPGYDQVTGIGSVNLSSVTDNQVR